MTGFTGESLDGAQFDDVSLGAIISDEWEHRLFAERDLDALGTRGALSLRIPG